MLIENIADNFKKYFLVDINAHNRNINDLEILHRVLVVPLNISYMELCIH